MGPGDLIGQMTWQEQEIQELRRLYGEARKTKRNLEEENTLLKEEINKLREQLLEARRK